MAEQTKRVFFKKKKVMENSGLPLSPPPPHRGKVAVERLKCLVALPDIAAVGCRLRVNHPLKERPRVLLLGLVRPAPAAPARKVTHPGSQRTRKITSPVQVVEIRPEERRLARERAQGQFEDVEAHQRPLLAPARPATADQH